MRRKFVIALFIALVAFVITITLLLKLRVKVPVVKASTTRRTKSTLIAKNYWGGTDCLDASIPITSERLAYSTLAYSDYYTEYPSGAFFDCKIVMNSVRIPTMTFAKFCATIIHEYGHLNGRHHSTNPYSIMYPLITSKNIPKVCYAN